MEELALHLGALTKALATLQHALRLQERVETKEPQLLELMQDGVIQRFEYTYESFWKFLKKCLEIKNNLTDINSPKKVFRACTAEELCSKSEGALLLDMAEARNVTSHQYTAEESRIIVTRIPKYTAVMASIVERVSGTL